MTESIIVALVTGGLSAVASVVATMITSNKHSLLMQYRQTQVEDKLDATARKLSAVEQRQIENNTKLDSLEKKQDKHNSMIERVYQLEKGQQVHDEKIRVANHRLEDLEHGRAGGVWQTQIKVPKEASVK